MHSYSLDALKCVVLNSKNQYKKRDKFVSKKETNLSSLNQLDKVDKVAKQIIICSLINANTLYCVLGVD